MSEGKEQGREVGKKTKKREGLRSKEHPVIMGFFVGLGFYCMFFC